MNNKKGMPNNMGGNNPGRMNAPKFNLSWLYMAVLIALLGLWMFNDQSTGVKQVSYDDFRSYVEKGYIKEVTG